MANYIKNISILKFRVFIGLLLQWQMFFFLIHPTIFSTNIDKKVGKYLLYYDVTSSVFANTEASHIETPVFLYANLDNHRLYVYKDKKLCQYLFVSGGTDETQTPLGTFKMNINNSNLSFTAPNREFYIRCTDESNFSGLPTGITNFSDGDLLLSRYDFKLLLECLTGCEQSAILVIHCSDYSWKKLSLNMCNQNVLDMQTKLRTLGFYSGPINGFFCEQTKQAVIEFQKRNALFATGCINSATYQKIKNAPDSFTTPLPFLL